jgi:hypothetical protein
MGQRGASGSIPRGGKRLPIWHFPGPTNALFLRKAPVFNPAPTSMFALCCVRLPSQNAPGVGLLNNHKLFILNTL